MYIMIHNVTRLHEMILTSPGKKQQCLRSMCLPNDICNSVSLMCKVSIMSDSQAKGWFRLADSLRGILLLMF